MQLSVHTDGSTVSRPWLRALDAGDLADGLLAQWQTQLTRVHHMCGFQLARLRVPTPCDLRTAETVLDFLLGSGIRPWLLFEGEPDARLLAHAHARYGEDEARRWPTGQIEAARAPRDLLRDTPAFAVRTIHAWLTGGEVPPVTLIDAPQDAQGTAPLYGGTGLVTLDGIVKPVYHAYRMLCEMGTVELAREPGAVVTRTEDGRLRALLYHYPPEDTQPCTAHEEAEHVLTYGGLQTCQLTLTGLPPYHRVLVETVDAHHGNVYAAWRKMGAPEAPSRVARLSLSREAMTTQTAWHIVNPDGVLFLHVSLTPWAFVSVREV